MSKQFAFDPDSASGWYLDLSKEDQARYNEFMHHLSNPRKVIPDSYKGAVKRMNKVFRKNIDPSLLTDEQVYEIDQYFVRTWYEQQPLAQLLNPVTSFMPVPRWLSKHYTVEGGDYPEFTEGGPNAFRVAKTSTVGVEPSTATGVGAAIRIDLSWTLLKEAQDGAYNPEMWHNHVAMKNFGVLWDQRLALGTAGENSPNDLGVLGLHNTTSLPTEAFGAGADNNLTAGWADLDIMFAQALGDLRSSKEPGPIVCVSTSGVASECLLGESSYTDRTDYQRIKEKWFDSGLIWKWIVDDNIEADTNATTTGRLQFVKLSPHILKRQVIYPFQKKPNTNTEFADDVAYTYLTADILKYYNLSGSTICSGDITTTVAGFVPNGLFMEGTKRDHMQAATGPTPKFY